MHATVLGIATDLQQDIERLVVWWIPAVLVTLGLTALANSYFSEIIASGDISAGDLISQLSVTNLLTSNVITNFDHIIVAIWLFDTTRKRSQGTPWIWFVFALFTGIMSALLYVGLCIYEQVNKVPDQPPNV